MFLIDFSFLIFLKFYEEFFVRFCKHFGFEICNDFCYFLSKNILKVFKTKFAILKIDIFIIYGFKALVTYIYYVFVN